MKLSPQNSMVTLVNGFVPEPQQRAELECIVAGNTFAGSCAAIFMAGIVYAEHAAAAAAAAAAACITLMPMRQLHCCCCCVNHAAAAETHSRI